MAGFRVFSAGEVLTASNINGYLAEQANVAVASGSYPTTVHEGMVVMDTTENREYDYSGAAWVRTANYWSPSARTGFFLRRTSNQTIPNNTSTAVSWDTENRDSDGYISTPGTTATIPSGLGGIYTLGTRAVWASDPTIGGAAYIEMVASGETFRTVYNQTGAVHSPVSANTQMSAPGETIEMGAGDTIVVNVLQNTSGGLILSDCKIWGYRVGV